eukprot:CAMPEP_0194482124 /NCGR_PEP_ID=MMETSP0253-20130528/4223_1 /TAXON_ID=2966 /ORGANISM="Noctiluca scintillans" /LENGTH=51 /DNA_ID=CAMNT_0039321645 /DNA_START=165 /DNA_END=320 /DNA_ORIENTATION=-
MEFSSKSCQSTAKSKNTLPRAEANSAKGRLTSDEPKFARRLVPNRNAHAIQ